MLFSCPKLDSEAVHENWDLVLKLLQHLQDTTPAEAYEPCGSGQDRGEFLVFLEADFPYVIEFVRNLKGQDSKIAKNMADT